MANLLYGITVLREVVRFLSDQANGLNANLTAGAEAFDQTPFTIDFSGASGNFALSNIRDVETSPLVAIDSQPCMCLFNAQDEDEGVPRGLRFAGSVVVGLRFFIRSHDGTPVFNTEWRIEWIKSAVLGALNNPALFWTQGNVSVLYTRRSRLDKNDFTEPLSDGFQQTIEFAIPFRVFEN